MEDKPTCILGIILQGAGIILLLAAAFDVLPLSDNKIIFLALACIIISTMITRIAKAKGNGSCCK